MVHNWWPHCFGPEILHYNKCMAGKAVCLLTDKKTKEDMTTRVCPSEILPSPNSAKQAPRLPRGTLYVNTPDIRTGTRMIRGVEWKHSYRRVHPRVVSRVVSTCSSCDGNGRRGNNEGRRPPQTPVCMCMGGTMHMWGPEVSLWESVLSFYTWVPGIKLRLLVSLPAESSRLPPAGFPR